MIQCASAHLTRTPSSDGNRRTWTWAAWVKRGKLGGYQSLFADQVNGGTEGAAIYFNTGDNRLVFEEYSSGGIQWELKTQQRFRDCSAWYHLTVVFNSPASTANERMRVYVNGSEVTDFVDRTNPSQNFDGSLNRARITDIASYGAFDTSYFDGMLADVYFIDGSALDPTSFGAFDSNGAWQAAVFSGTFGSNGFHLSFSDATSTTTIAEDSSGNNNDFTAANISVSAGAGNDSLFDVPTNGDTSSESGAGGEVSGNYCCLNPLHRNPAGNATTKNGNLVWGGSDNNHHCIAGTFAISSGKWYWEATMTANPTNYIGIGMCAFNHTFSNAIPGYGEDTAFTMYNTAGRYYYNPTSTSAYGTSWTTGDVIGVRYDEGAVYFYKNGTIMSSSPILTLTGSWCRACSIPMIQASGL